MHHLNLYSSLLQEFNRRYKKIERVCGRCHIEEYKDYGQTNLENKFKIISATGSVLASFTMTTLPGCCGSIVLSFRTIRVDKKLAKRFAKIILDLQEAASKDANFTQLIATCLNGEEYALYTVSEWKPLDDFTNNKTGNHVTMFVKHIAHEKRVANYGEGA